VCPGTGAPGDDSKRLAGCDRPLFTFDNHSYHKQSSLSITGNALNDIAPLGNHLQRTQQHSVRHSRYAARRCRTGASPPICDEIPGLSDVTQRFASIPRFLVIIQHYIAVKHTVRMANGVWRVCYGSDTTLQSALYYVSLD
jgi:hypothetical protein